MAEIDYPIHHPLDVVYATPESLVAPLCVNHVNDTKDSTSCPYSMEGGVIPCLVKYPYIECTYIATGVTDESGSTVVSPVKLYNKVPVRNVIGMTVDGALHESLVSSYTFNTIGEHVVRFYSKSSVISSLNSSSAFTNCVRLKKVTGLGNVTGIGRINFKGCTNLISTDYSNKCVSIDIGAFRGCSSLLTPGDMSGVKSINQSASDGAFHGCSSLKKLNFTSNLVTLGNSSMEGNYGLTFAFCSSLISVGDFSHAGSTLGEYSFNGCGKIESIDLSGITGVLGQRCFNNCSSLKEVKNTEGIKQYHQNCFSACTSLTGEFIIGENCSGINSYAFTGCRNISSMKILAVNPPVLASSDAFDGTSFNIYVPAESLDMYKAASQWKNISSRIFAIE